MQFRGAESYQLARINIKEDQKVYLIGERHKEEKKEQGRQKIDNIVGTVHTLPAANDRAVQKIAEQSKINSSL